MPNHPKVAIHAHPEDGITTATVIRSALSSLDVRIWAEDAKGWVLNLRQIDYLIVVGSKTGLESPEFMELWRRAYNEGTAIFLLPLSGFPLNRLPSWARDSYAYPDDEEGLKRVARLMRNPYPRIRILDETPLLPNDYLERPALLNQTKAHLLEQRRVCLYGEPGSGRTLLAAALCRQPEISTAARNGVIWIEVGARRTALTLLTNLYQRLAVSQEAFSDEQEAVAALNARLRGKPVLIVLEDVFEWSQIAPFLALEDQVQLVITSDRAYESLPSVKLIGMEADEAVRYLSSGFPGQTVQAARVIDLSGSLPGDLRLLKGVLNALEQNWVQLESLLLTGVDPTLAALSRFSEDEAAHYRSLSVFVEGVTVPLSSVSALWDIEAGILCRRFETAGLLTVIPEGVRARYRFPVESVDHLRLLSRWGDPFALPDGYAATYYPYHLEAAGKEVLPLLRNLGWMRLRLAKAEAPMILKDYDRPDLLGLHQVIKNTLPQIVQEPRQILTALAGLAEEQFEDLKAQVEAVTDEYWLYPVGAVSRPVESALRLTLKGHRDFIGGLVMLPDGQTLVSASEDGSMRVWDTGRGLCVRTLGEHTEAVNHLALSPDGRWIASASDDYTILLWDTETWKVQRVFRGHTNFVSRVAFTPDGARLLSVSRDHTVRLWDVYSEEQIALFEGHQEWVISVAVSPDGRFAATASINNVMLLWNLAELRLESPLSDFSQNFIGNLDFPQFSSWLFTHSPNTSGKGHRDYPHDLKFLPDGRLVSADESVKLWSIPEGLELSTIATGALSIQRIQISRDGKRMFTAMGRLISVWEIESGRLLKSYAEHTDEVTSLTLSPDERRLISGAKDKTIRIWDLTQETLPVVAHTASIADLIRSGERLISSGHDGIVKVWDLRRGELLHTLGGHVGRFVAIGAAGTTLVTAAHESAHSDYQVWDLESGRNLAAFAGVKYEWVDELSVTSDGRYAVMGRIDGDVLLQWGLNPLEERQPFEDVIQQVTGLAISPDNSLVAASTYKNRVLRVYRMDTRQVIFSAEQPEPIYFTSVSFSPDQRWLAAGTNGGSIECYQLPGFDLRHTLLTPQRYVSRLIFIDTQRFLTYSGDGYIRLWDVVEGGLVQTLDAHDQEVRKAHFEGERMLSVSTREAKLWRLRGKEFDLLARYVSSDKLHYAVLSADGSRFAVGGESGQLRILELRGGQGENPG